MTDTTDKCIAIIFSLLILGNAFQIKRLVGTWLFPAGLFSLFWFGYTFFPLVFMFSVPINPLTIIFIWFCTIFFSISALIFNWNKAFKRNTLKLSLGQRFNTTFLVSSFYVFSLLALFFFYLTMLSQGFSINDMIFNIFETAGKNIQMRYSKTFEPNIFSKLSMTFSYLSITIGGLIFGEEKSNKKRTLLLVIAFLPALASMLFQGSKGLLFLFAALFFAGILITRIFKNHFYIFDNSTVKVTLTALLAVIPALIISFLSRGLYGNGDSEYLIQKLSYYISSYAFAHLYAFSDWFSFAMGGNSINNYSEHDLGYGFHTFTALFKILGSTEEVPHGVYEEYYKHEDLLQSNIYTIFRGIIMDIGLLGSLLYFLLSGILLHLSFYSLLCNKKPVIPVVIFIFMVGYFYESFIISIFIWNIIPFSIFLLTILLYLNKNNFDQVFSTKKSIN